jgi:hypothetical protein
MPYLPYRNKLKDFPRTVARIAIAVTKQKKKAGFDSNAYGIFPPINNNPVGNNLIRECSEGDALALTGAINSVNTTFVTTVAYISATLMVFLNGVLQCRGAGNDWTETDPAAGEFDFNTAPDPGDIISVLYEMDA